MNNHGIIHEPIPCDCLPLGSVGLSAPDLVPDGDGERYLPQYEPQSFAQTETMSCVSFSLLTHVESQRILHGLGELNFSDRFLAVQSGTTEQGNTFGAVYDAAIRAFSCLEAEHPAPQPPFTFAEYHSKDVPEKATEGAKKQKEAHGLGMRVYVPATADDFRAALKKVGSLWCWNQNHAFVVYRCDDRIRIFDTYPYGGNDVGKRSLPLEALGTDDLLGAYYVPLLIKPDPMDFKEKHLYQLTEGIGGFFHFRNGTLTRDTEAKLLAEFISVNGGDISGKVGKVTLKQIKGVQLFNTKGKPVTLGNPV